MSVRRPHFLAWVSLALAALSPGCGGSTDEVREDAVRRYVEAWVGDRADLAATVTGDQSERLIAALSGVRRGGAVRTTLERFLGTGAESGPVEGVVAIVFADGGTLQLEIRARVEEGRVLAEPPAVAAALVDWQRLRIDEFGSPVDGETLSRTGSLLAAPGHARRPAAREALNPAVRSIRAELGSELAGAPGRRLVAGRRGPVLARSQPRDGVDIKTSLDDAAQAAAEKALGETPGALVAVDPRTGGIRALVSNPEPEAPRRSPATSGYSPGSAFKLVTAAAALEADLLGPSDTISCPARLTVDEAQIANFEEFDYGRITFEKALAVSCNTAFAHIGDLLGTARLLGTAQELGFRVGDLDGPGTIAVPRSRGELAVWAYGAAGSLASPLQLAGLGATIASGGLAVSPSWTDSSTRGERMLSEESAIALTGMMEEVVESGTGQNAALPGVRIAGKTGTAEARPGRQGSDGWFVGLAPSRDTRLVAVGFVPDAGLGGDAAATLVQRLLLAVVDTWR